MIIYESVTNPILQQLEAAVVPWRKAWTVGLPKNLATGRECRGLNLLVLGTAPFTSRYWLTYREALRRGGHVREGEQATPVVYGSVRPEELGKRAGPTDQAEPASCVPLTSAIFNLDQVAGVPRPEDDLPSGRVNRLEVAELLLTIRPDMPRMVHGVVTEPAYQPLTDTITLPHLSQLKTAEQYYSGLFRGLVRSTAASHRLNGLAEVRGDPMERQCFETLVAELGAAFLCGFAGISNASTQGPPASEIKNWVTALRQDPHLLGRAASAAQRAADYIRGKSVSVEPVAVDELPAAELPACALAG
jgi:antirestriction protein ArdC